MLYITASGLFWCPQLAQQLSLGISGKLLSAGDLAETNSLITRESARGEVVLSGSKGLRLRG